jgi:hypothetical protein
MICFKKFDCLIHLLISEFVAAEGGDWSEFTQQCKDSLEGRFCALFEEDLDLWFVEALLAISDYSAFYEMMKKEAERRLTLGAKRSMK